MKKTKLPVLILVLAIVTQFSFAETHDITVNVKKPGSPIQKTMYGIFFEDINFGADGGLYAEMIKNRSLGFHEHLLGWTTFGNVQVRTDGAPFPRNPHYVRLSYPGHPDKRSGLDNEGYFGISVKKDAGYRFSVWARSPESDSGNLLIELIDPASNVFFQQKLEITSKDWKKYQFIFKAPKTEVHARLRIFLKSNTPVDMDFISMFPTDTWKGRKNGLRKDLVEALYNLHPGVFRFPGGCIVEGTDMNTRYQWKNTIGPVENRPTNQNRWEYTFENRFFPDYYQSYGLGFYEYFQLAEDIGAEALPVLNVGMICQFQNNGEKCQVPVSKINPFVQDALDLIQFANGDTTTHWGRIRAQMGHPASFHLKMIGIGNEQWGPMYPARLEPFIKAIRAKYPKIKIVGSSGPSPSGKRFDYGWKEMKKLKVDLVDEHYYRDPKWFLTHANRYDNYDRKGPKVFAGEYACHPANGKNDFEGALCEAAFMTGFERNADVVYQTTYAPLFARVNGWQWKPDLIWFDNTRLVLTPNYYVQQMYSTHVGTNVLNTVENKLPLEGKDGLYASSVIDKNKNEIYLKIANTSDSIRTVDYTLKGLKNMEYKGTHTILTSNNPDAENTLDHPDVIVPTTSSMNFAGNSFTLKLHPKSFNLYVIKL